METQDTEIEDLDYTTTHEMGFIRKLGTFKSPSAQVRRSSRRQFVSRARFDAFGPDLARKLRVEVREPETRAEWLEEYIRAAPGRMWWGDVDPLKAVAYARALLLKLDNRKAETSRGSKADTHTKTQSDTER